MNSYWFYLESYVFIFEGFRYYAIYNTLNGVYLKYKKEGVLNDIILKLQQLENGYCVLLNDADLAISIVENFVFQLRNSFSADLVNIKLSPNKPFVFMPKLNLMENENDMKDQSISGRNVLSNLSEVFIYLNSNCKYECYYCDIAYKQFACCKKSNMSTMGVNECLSVLNKIELAGVSVVNFLGGDVLEYEFLDELLFNLHRFKFKKIFYVYYKSILSEKKIPFSILMLMRLKYYYLLVSMKKNLFFYLICYLTTMSLIVLFYLQNKILLI